MAAERADRPFVTVAVLTYDRQDLLARFLDAFDAMATPACSRLALIVVDNSAGQSARTMVETRKSAIAEIRYVSETRKGIPIARNRALDEAVSIGADVMCFIDDDEFPDREWLNALVACWQGGDAVLLGGPVEVAAPPPGATPWQALVNRSLQARMRRKNAKSARIAAGGGRCTIVTNNWLLDLDWQRRHGLRFDESLRFTGGSDTAFYRALVDLGGKPGWCPQARVFETMTPDRLSLAYQFSRGAEQSKTNYHGKNSAKERGSAAGTVCLAAARIGSGMFLFCVPIFGMASPVIAVRSIGWAVGRVKALTGGRSRLYE